MKKKRWTLLSSDQWLGILALMLIGVIVVLSLYFIDRKSRENLSDNQLVEITSKAAELERYVNQRQSEKHYVYKKDTVSIFLHEFDPNKADSAELRQLGFTGWMARNVVKYRSKGGRYRNKESLKTIFGMTDSLYAQIEPYIMIIPDTIDSIRPKMFRSVKRDTILELNSCDTAQLMLIRGIGRYTAIRILSYRDSLGGYLSVDQLNEILGERADSIKTFFITNVDSIKPIMVNYATVKRLYRHPYINFTQAQLIYEYRHKRLELKSIEDIESLSCFSPEELLKLQPYLSFEKK